MDDTVLRERRLDLGQALDGAAAADTLVLEDDVSFRILDGDDLVFERTGILCGCGLLV